MSMQNFLPKVCSSKLLLFQVFTNKISLTSKFPRSPRRKPCTRTQDVSWENPLGEEKPNNLSLSSSIHKYHVMLTLACL